MRAGLQHFRFFLTLLVGSYFIRKIVSEMTYIVSSGTLNPTIPYYFFENPNLDMLRLMQQVRWFMGVLDKWNGEKPVLSKFAYDTLHASLRPGFRPGLQLARIMECGL